MISELVADAIPNIASVRKFFFRTILFIAMVVAAFSFTIGMMFRDYLYSKPVSAADIPISAPVSTGARMEFYVIIIPPLVMSLFMILHLLLLKRRDRSHWVAHQHSQDVMSNL